MVLQICEDGPETGPVVAILVRAPKLCVREGALVHALFGIGTRDQLLGYPVAGGSWEGWVIENRIAAAPPGASAWFYRSPAGVEVELVACRVAGRIPGSAAPAAIARGPAR